MITWLRSFFDRQSQVGQVNNSYLGAVVFLIVVVLLVLFLTGRI